ncbi:MAG: hypothetical protein KME35_17610 [Aphanocapsa sp. GSE-SYN-MK-11-07L]|nr:hypothetical protein [Aphanocapsa sp. GSE-SYN-MK-11-07L]
MARLRTAPEVISMAMKVRSEGLGIRATGRVKHHHLGETPLRLQIGHLLRHAAVK